MSLAELIQLVLASFGGATLALLALSKWLGQVWANRILENEKAKHNRELEEYKSRLELEVNKSSRYIDAQFDLYNSLWEALYSLRVAGDALWDRASLKNLKSFTAKLTKAEEMIHKRSLLIEVDHQRQLIALIQAFDGFRIGKENLINLRKGSYLQLTKVETGSVNAMIQRAIDENRGIRNQYNALADRIQLSLQERMRGNLVA